jgi:dTMP kinase
MSFRRNDDLPGRLFVVEGIDGSGKSTQIDLLSKWLASEGYLVTFTEWNSSPIVKGTTKKGKKRHLLTPLTFSLIHAADFAGRTHAQILPALQAGAIVLADRYAFTAFVRDGVRGMNREWVERLYSFAVQPHVAFYFDVPLDESLRRILVGRPELKFYEAGLDLDLSPDPYESFRLFQGRILEQYEEVVAKYGLTRIDATQTLVHQQQQVREIVKPFLDGVVKSHDGSLAAALQRAQLKGRYLIGANTQAEV